MVPKVTKGQMYRLQKTLKTDERIGHELKISRQAVHQLRKKLGVAAASTEKPERDAEIAAAYIGGETGIAIAKKFGMSISQTYRIINAANGKGKRKAAAKRAGLPAPKELGRKASVKKAASKSAGKKSVKKKTVTKKAAPAKKKVGKKRSKKR
ncbi:MAG: hypothetical protein LBB74_03280 [Chitinispirillales bacterium]|jgi:Mor family transcriptional regulator|nr:hypothetical protein [Chitinispirillales bacterium]